MDIHFSLTNALMLAAFGWGVHVYAEHCRRLLSMCRLFPLPLLRRWKRKHRLLNRPSLVWAAAWIAFILIAEWLINTSWVLLNFLTALSTDRIESRAFLLGAVVAGVCLRHVISYPAPPDEPPGDNAGPFLEGE